MAEKLQATVGLGRSNSRMKDYADLLTMSREFEFNGGVLLGAIQATFRRRNTAIPRATPDGLSDDFAVDVQKMRQWEAFRNRNDLDPELTLAMVVIELRRFLEPPMFAAAGNIEFSRQWTANGYWA